MQDSPQHDASRPETRRDAKEKLPKEPPELKRFKKLLRQIVKADPKEARLKAPSRER
jgi:hypothetical protein